MENTLLEIRREAYLEKGSEDEAGILPVLNELYPLTTGISLTHAAWEYLHQIQDILPEAFLFPQGIHGVNHARRVAFLSLLLCRMENLGEKDKAILMAASKLHDIGRINDYDCEIHGYLSYKKAAGLNLIKIRQPEELEILKYVIENHCMEDEHAIKRVHTYALKNMQRAVYLLKLFKDADALDRIRTNDLDEKYLRYPFSKKLIETANQLFSIIH